MNDETPFSGDDSSVDGVESFALVSLGLDIGTATSHLGLTHLVFRRMGSHLSARYVVAERHTTYRSPIVLTPYSTPQEIDVDRLEAYVDDFLREAQVARDGIDTGLVVITGEALTKRNAAAISRWFADRIGSFTCVSAGAHHEAVLAAHGSGALRHSRESQTRGLCIDIGGGTTKLAVIDRGDIVATLALHLGGRLLAFDEAGVITRFEQPAAPLLAEIGVSTELGSVVTDDELMRLVERMASHLADVVTGKVSSEQMTQLRVTKAPNLSLDAEFDWIIFSGGVSEYVHTPQSEARGDLGLGFGRAIRSVFAERGIWRLVRPGVEGIRATVVGAGGYTVQASGMTSYVSDQDHLPVRGLQVLRVIAAADAPQRISDDLLAALAHFDRAEFAEDLAIAIEVQGLPRYPYVRAIAEAIVRVASTATAGTSLHVVTDDDIARSLGYILAEELRWPGPIVVLDGISVGQLDYLDIGRPVSAVGTLPVTVTSLIFPHDGASSALPWDSLEMKQ